MGGRLAAACGILPTEARDVVLNFAYKYITQQWTGELRNSVEPLVDFHLTGGAALHALHWRADDSALGLTHSFGVMASFVYWRVSRDRKRKSLCNQWRGC